MSKHAKTDKPTDADLKGNPLIGGSKGVTRAQAGPDDLDALKGENTIEGDRENNPGTPDGGIAKADAK